MIRFRLEPRGAFCLDFQVLEEDASQRIYDARFVASNGFEVASVTVPELQLNKVYLRGRYNPNDAQAWSLEFNNPGDRDAVIPRVLLALREWAEGGGFKHCLQLGEPMPRVQVPPVYEF